MRPSTKKPFLLLLSLLLLGCLAACGGQAPAESTPTDAQQTDFAESGDEERILIAYFTRLDNTDADLDAIVRGGGPYGPLGNSFEDADIDAISSASITVLESETYGNTEAIARMLQEETGGELFSIQTAEGYPVDYGALIDQGGEEKNAAARPELSTQVEGMEEYDIVFLGYPNWWYDLPMPVYQFLESYDFTGKTLIPFSTSAGSGFSNTIRTIRDLLPGAAVNENGLHIPMREVATAQPAVSAWVEELGLTQGDLE